MDLDLTRMEEELSAMLEKFMDEELLHRLVRLNQTEGNYKLFFHTALNHQKNAERSVEGMVAALKGGSFNSQDMGDSLTVAREGLRWLEKFFRACLSPEWFAGEPTPASSRLAQQVFDIPELAELIFTFLDIREILKVQQVNKMMRDIVNGSSRLQHQLFLQVEQNGQFQVPKLPLEISVDDYWPPVHMDQWDGSVRRNPGKTLSITMTSVPHLGTKVGNIHLCQPPIKFMRYGPSCCELLNHDQAERELHRVGGIRVGDLAQAASVMMAEHKLCPFADAADHDTIGNVVVRVFFFGGMDLEEDDPAVKAIGEKRDPEQYKRMQAYATAKRKAFMSGVPIPTLAEYEASIAKVE